MNVFIRKRGANPLRIAYSKRYINMVTIYNTPLSTTSEKALFGRPGSGGKPCVLRIDFLQSKKKVFHVRYASQLGSEVFYFGIERFGRGIG